MSESPERSNESPGAVTKPSIRWDAGTIIASLIGLLALLVASYTASVQRQQVRAQVWPYLIGAYSGKYTGLLWTNKGVGPAIVRTIEITANGQPLQDWSAVFHFLDISKAAFDQSFLDGNVVSPGETVEWIHFRDAPDYHDFLSAWNHRKVDAVICYCSTLGECWKTRMAQSSRMPVPACPALPESMRFTE